MARRRTELESVEPARPPAAYIGGKRVLANRIITKINQTPHGLYAEPFVGMGGVFLRRDRRPKGEVINDLNGEVATLFRILQRHFPQFMETLKYQITSRREFDRLKASDPSTLTDLERAARFLYLQRLAFGGKVSGQNFGVTRERARFDITRLASLLEDVHERIAGTIIENLPWDRFVDRYDRADTLFYLDPPYWGGESDYGAELFDQAQFGDLATRLANLKGRFILSINDTPATRELFGGFRIEPVTVNYFLQGGKPKPSGELIVSR